jgi:N-acyl-L-homoserine lactone synthetase
MKVLLQLRHRQVRHQARKQKVGEQRVLVVLEGEAQAVEEVAVKEVLRRRMIRILSISHFRIEKEKRHNKHGQVKAAAAQIEVLSHRRKLNLGHHLIEDHSHQLNNLLRRNVDCES